MVQVNGSPYTDFDHFQPLTDTYIKTDFDGFGLTFRGLNLKEIVSEPSSFMKWEGNFAEDILFDDEYQEIQAGFSSFDGTEPGVYKFYVRQTLTSFWKLIATITITN